MKLASLRRDCKGTKDKLKLCVTGAPKFMLYDKLVVLMHTFVPQFSNEIFQNKNPIESL